MLTGGCLCGGVRFQINEALGPIVCCHCSVCRRISGTAFASNASVQSESFHISSGEDLVKEFQSSENTIRAFCSRCGSPVYGRFISSPAVRRVRVGTLDSDPGNRPIANIFVGSKAPWFAGTEHLECFEEAPPASYRTPADKK